MDPADSNRNRVAEGLRWTAYLLFASAMGLVWLPVALFVASGNTSDLPVQEILWLLLTGLFTGLGLAWQTARRPKRPSGWFSLLFPFYGTLGRVAAYVLTGAPPDLGNSDYFSFFLFNLFFSYVLMGWVVIPVAFPYVWVLKKVYARLDRWAAEAKRRDVRRFSWGLVAVAGMALSEANHFQEGRIHRGRMEFLSGINAEASPGIRFLTEPSEAERQEDGTARAVWVHDSGRKSWPPSKQATFIDMKEDRKFVLSRVRREANVAIEEEAEVQHARWWVGQQLVFATLVRTKAGDFIEYRLE